MRMRWIMSLILYLLFAQPVYASDFMRCFDQAGARYNINPTLLKAIGKVESNFNARAENLKTKARGVMQIHPWWFAKIEEMGTSPEQLWDGCTNIFWGAWILAQEIQRYGYSWTAVGAYGAGGYTTDNVEERKEQYKIYAKKVADKLKTMKN